MSEIARLQLKIRRGLKARVIAEAEARGQSLTVFTERALEAALPQSPDPQVASPRAFNPRPKARDA